MKQADLDLWIKQTISYCPETGNLHYISGGDLISGYIGRAGYLRVTVGGRPVEAHRVAFFINSGFWPEMVDHINGDKLDNRACNLRAVTNQQNQQNSKIPKNNKSGVKGVRLDHRTGKWVAEIKHNRKSRHLGSYTTLSEAKIARAAAEKALLWIGGNVAG